MWEKRRTVIPGARTSLPIWMINGGLEQKSMQTLDRIMRSLRFNKKYGWIRHGGERELEEAFTLSWPQNTGLAL